MTHNYDVEVSVIMPSYNSEAYIEQSIRSVQQQSHVDWELIIVDDFSTDDSVGVIQLLAAQDRRIKLISLSENLGAAVARNTALATAKGRYIAFLDADDIWLPEKLSKQLRFMKENDIAFSYSAYEKMTSENNILGLVNVPGRVNYSELLKTCVIGCLTAIYDTKHFGKIEMPLVRKRQDFGLWLKLLRQTDFAYGLHEPLARYRVHENSISFNKIDVAKHTWFLYRQVEGMGIVRSLYYFAFYSINGVIRHKFPWLANKIGFFD